MPNGNQGQRLIWAHGFGAFYSWLPDSFLAPEQDTMPGGACGGLAVLIRADRKRRGRGREKRGGREQQEEGGEREKERERKEGKYTSQGPALLQPGPTSYLEPPKIALPARDQNLKNVGDISESVHNAASPKFVAFHSSRFLNLPGGCVLLQCWPPVRSMGG